jgi:hypothetical protein
MLANRAFLWYHTGVLARRIIRLTYGGLTRLRLGDSVVSARLRPVASPGRVALLTPTPRRDPVSSIENGLFLHRKAAGRSRRSAVAANHGKLVALVPAKNRAAAGLLLAASLLAVLITAPATARPVYTHTGSDSAYAETSNPAFGLDPKLQPQGFNYTGVYKVRELDPNLTGAGVTIAVISRSTTYIAGQPQNDYKPAANHNCFANTQFSFYDYAPAAVLGKQDAGAAGDSTHCTAVCSILFGQDPNAYYQPLGDFYYQAVSPQAKADIYEFWYFLTNNIFAGSAPDANIITASFGSQFQDWWTRGFEALAEQAGITVVAGIGNGFNACDPVLYPGAGANVIGVGVINSVRSEDAPTALSHFALAYPLFSSQGPTGDGRCKPDIVAPGNCLIAGHNEPNLYQPAGNWSSFATPIVAGTAALLVQKANENPSLALALSPEGGNCVIKAILLNSARKLPFWHKGLLAKDDDHAVPLDYLQGAGSLDAVAAYNQLTAGRFEPGVCPAVGWDLNKLNLIQKPVNTHRISVTEPTGKMITVTGCWNKHYNAVYPFDATPEKDVDLRIELWAVDANEPDRVLLDYSDSIADNIEHLWCKTDPNYTEYEIVISYSDIDDVNQPAETPPYALAWSVTDEPAKDNPLWYDLNADLAVDDADVGIMMNNIVAAIENQDRYLLGDINSDGSIDIKDLRLLLDYINASPAPTAAANGS